MLSPSDIFANAAFLGAGEAFTLIERGEAAHGHHAQIVSTTTGRAKFPDILQSAFGEGFVTVAERYGRPLGAVVPMVAVQFLAVCTDPAISASMQSDDPAQVVSALMQIEKEDGVRGSVANALLKNVHAHVAASMGDGFMKRYGFRPD